MTYRLTPRAVEDVEAIAAYLAEFSPERAVNLVRLFIERWDLLAVYPYSGASRDDILPGLRQVVLAPYIAFYRVEEQNVVILRVLHSRRDITNQDIG